MSKPRLLDLFCGAGGSAVGLARAGFEVVGVDNRPQPHYPFEFILANALTISLEGYDAFWASPPCQGYSMRNNYWKRRHPRLIGPIRDRLIVTEKPYIIENVVGAPLQSPILLCGVMFGLGVIRHRLFESNYLLLQPHHPKHNGTTLDGTYVQVVGHASKKRPYEDYRKWNEAMGIDWMTRKEIVEAIPPAYAEYLGRQLIKCYTQ